MAWKKDKYTSNRWYVPNRRGIGIYGVFGKSPYHVMLFTVTEFGTSKFGGGQTIKVFKTKSVALAFAKRWMKAHPDG